MYLSHVFHNFAIHRFKTHFNYFK